MTASEANRQRVLELLRIESELMRLQVTDFKKEPNGVKRCGPAVSKAWERWMSAPAEDEQSKAG